MRDIFSSDRLMDQLFRILEESDPRVRVYAYRMIGGSPHKTRRIQGRTVSGSSFGIPATRTGRRRISSLDPAGRNDAPVRSGSDLPPVPRKSSEKHP